MCRPCPLLSVNSVPQKVRRSLQLSTGYHVAWWEQSYNLMSTDLCLPYRFMDTNAQPRPSANIMAVVHSCHSSASRPGRAASAVAHPTSAQPTLYMCVQRSRRHIALRTGAGTCAIIAGPAMCTAQGQASEAGSRQYQVTAGSSKDPRVFQRWSSALEVQLCEGGSCVQA
jgi:hypothetical protein